MSDEKTTTEENIDAYAIIDLFGHTRLVGKVSNVQIGGASFLRVDVINRKGEQAQTEYYGLSAIYSIKPVSEEIARAQAQHHDPQPVSNYTLQDAINRLDHSGLERIREYADKRLLALPAASEKTADIDDLDDGDSGEDDEEW
jgi:hypothetical protein